MVQPLPLQLLAHPSLELRDRGLEHHVIVISLAIHCLASSAARHRWRRSEPGKVLVVEVAVVRSDSS